MDKDFHKDFKKCPCCGSEERFLEQLGNEMKERGLASDKWSFHLDVKRGVAVDPAKVDAIPYGSEIPGYGLMTDICIDCGCIYAINITRIEAKKEIAPTPPILPNRAQRRRDTKEGGLPFSLS